MKPFKVLNLYACLGGNRYKWADCEVTAVELDPELSRLYQERFPNDTVITEDAHEYLLKNYKNFDFIWSSPPCPTHSRLVHTNRDRSAYKLQYPDMRLYQEIILLQNMYKGLFCVENVVSYYDPLITPQKRGRHYYWTNFKLPLDIGERNDINGIIGKSLGRNFKKVCEFHDYNFKNYKGNQRIDKIAANLVDYEAGLTIFNTARGIITKSKTSQGEIDF